MSPVTSALIDYWRRLSAEPAAARRERLRIVVAEVGSGRVATTALVPFALGDDDAGIVASATQAYVDASRAHGARRAALADACEWTRRGLALNRGAVYAALLAVADEEALACLAGQRLVLEPSEVETICRIVARSPLPRRARRFVHEWIALLEDADAPNLARQRAALLGIAGSEATRASQFAGSSAASTPGSRTVPSQPETSRVLRSSSHAKTSACHETRCT
jgi:hypothetical protein